MSLEDAGTHKISTCMVEVFPGEVYAGADMTLKGKVSCSQPCDLRGQTLKITDRDGALVDRPELTEFNGETNETREFVVKAPVEPGAHTWLAVYPAHVKEGMSHEETSALFSFTVKPHTTSMAVWDIPSAIAAGDRFSIKVGIKCPTGCTLTGREFEIYDHKGAQVATGAVRDDPWPRTTALYFAEVELEAPDTEGYYEWEAKFPASDLVIPHEEDSRAFGVKIVSAPEFRVTVSAIDRDEQTPIEGIHILLHPFRAFTDERGVAEVRVPKGEYQLHVSGLRYIPFHTSLEVTEDTAAKAELSREPEHEPI